MPSTDTIRKPGPVIGRASLAGPGPLALAVICAGYFLVILDATVVNVARPAGGGLGVALLGGLVGGPSFVGGLRVALVVAAAAFLARAVLTALGGPAARGTAGPPSVLAD